MEDEGLRHDIEGRYTARWKLERKATGMYDDMADSYLLWLSRRCGFGRSPLCEHVVMQHTHHQHCTGTSIPSGDLVQPE